MPMTFIIHLNDTKRAYNTDSDCATEVFLLLHFLWWHNKHVCITDKNICLRSQRSLQQNGGHFGCLNKILLSCFFRNTYSISECFVVFYQRMTYNKSVVFLDVLVEQIIMFLGFIKSLTDDLYCISKCVVTNNWYCISKYVVTDNCL